MMSLATLEKTLRSAVKSNGSLAFTGSLVSSTSIGSLIEHIFPTGVLELAGTSVKLDSVKEILSVVGTTGIVKVAGVSVTIELTLEKQTGTLEMVCALALPDGWKMTDVFDVLLDEQLKSLIIHGTRLLLTTGPFDDPVSNRKLAAGLNLSGELQVNKTFPYLATLLGSGGSITTVSGPIDDFKLPLFEFTTGKLLGSLGSVPITDIRLSLAMANIATSSATPLVNAETTLVATLAIAGKSGILSASLPSSTSVFSLDVKFANLSLSDLTDLQPFIGSADPFSALPAPIQTQITKIGGAFELKNLGFRFDLASQSFLSADLGLTVDLKGFKIFSVIPELKVDELDLTFRVNNATTPTTFAFGAAAEITLGTNYAVVVGFQTQFANHYLLTLKQKPGVVLKLGDVLSTFVPGLSGFPDLEVETFSLSISPPSKRYTFRAAIKSDWKVIKTPELTLEQIYIDADYNGKSTPSASGGVVGLLALAVDANHDNDVLITLAARRDPGASGWKFQGTTPQDQPIPVGNLVDAIVKKFSAEAKVPDIISKLTIEDLSLSFDTDAKTKSFHFGTLIRLPFNDNIELDLTVSIDVEWISQGYEATFRGKFLVRQYEFNVVFDHKSSGTNTLIATYSPAAGASQSVKLVDLLEGISPSLAKDVPVDIEIDLKDVKFVFYSASPDNKLAFGLDVGVPIDLSNIPIVGDKLPAGFSLAVSNLQGVYATESFDKSAIAEVNSLLPGEVESFPADGLIKGANLSAHMVIGSTTKEFVLSGAKPKKQTVAVQESLSTRPVNPHLVSGLAVGSPDENYKWIDVNKQIGIFQFNRAGVGYIENRLTLAMDAGVNLGPLTFTMDGLSVGSPLGEFDPVFGLNGLGLAYNRPPLSISGNFLKVKEPSGTSYYGQVSVQFKSIGFAALGGWSPDAKPPSFFLYASINVPLGGPPFLFVTGLAAGLGINRTLLLPTVEELPGYILLPGSAPQPEGSPSATVAKVLPQLQKYFQPKSGQFWVAAGLKFTSFEMVDAFVLVTVALGVDFQIGVIGTCSMSLPSGTKKPIAYIEVDLIATFTPSAGVLAVDGRLSPHSFLYGGFVKLSGGFAFYLWFDGDNAGDFVISIGGYYPSFIKPAHYPAVPRLKMEFALGPLSVTGTAYFALTPSMLMAGINLSAVWESGPIKAWFDAGLNFLVAWAPFHYEANIYISLGASVDLGLFTASFHIGADMDVWGPAFGGRAHIDLDVVTFTIEFGAPQEQPKPIGWEEFRTNFLPKDGASEPKTSTHSLLTAASRSPNQVEAASKPEGNIIKAQVKRGLNAATAPGFDWIVAANGFDIVISSTVPANAGTWTQPKGASFQVPNSVAAFEAKSPTKGQPFLKLPNKKDYTYSKTEVWNPTIDVGPMKKKAVTSTLAITVTKVGGTAHGDIVTDLTLEPQLTNSNTALWLDQGTKDANAPRLLMKTLTGFAVSPIPRKPDRVSDVPLIQLLFIEGNDVSFNLQEAAVVPGFTVQATGQATPTLVISISGSHDETLTNDDYVLSALDSPWVATQRDAAAKELRDYGFGTYKPSEIDLHEMATNKKLTDWPIVRQLGA